MNLKKFTTGCLMAMSLLLAVPGFSSDIRPANRIRTTEPISPAEAEQLTKRLEEIKAMDLKSLPRSERRALRKEVKEIDQKVQDGGYIYISVGALLLIILLLILLL
jgi:hypothetical protein